METVFMNAIPVIPAGRAALPVIEDDYLELVREFPLRPIRSKAELNLAIAILDRLVGRDDLTPGQRDYVEAIAHFVRLYEEQTVRTMFGRLKPVEVLRHLMRENNMNTSDLGAILGSRGLASEVLNGKWGLSKTLILKLTRRFHLDLAVFLDAEAEKTHLKPRA